MLKFEKLLFSEVRQKPHEALMRLIGITYPVAYAVVTSRRDLTVENLSLLKDAGGFATLDEAVSFVDYLRKEYENDGIENSPVIPSGKD